MATAADIQQPTPPPVAVTGVYAAALGPSQLALAPPVHELHCAGQQVDAAGRLTVRRGPGLFVWLVANGLGLPGSGDDVPLRLHVERSDRHETWQRHFGDEECLRTTQRIAGPGHIEERVGRARILLEVRAFDGALQMRQVAAAIRVGGLRVPLPAWLCPRTTASAAPAPGGGVAVTVRVALPYGRLLLTYAGVVKQVRR